MHYYLNWAKQRIDEMDAVLASLEAKADKVHAESKVKAEQLIADLKKRRDEFQSTAKKQVEEGEAAWQRTKPQLETQWQGFEEQVKTYLETMGKQIEQQQATFREVAAVQIKAWRDAADQLHAEAAKMATAKRADVEAAVKQMKADAAEAEARLQKFKQAGGESWTALSAAWLSHERPSIEPVSRDGMHSRAPQGRRPERLRPAPFLAKFDIPKSYGLRQQNRRFISALGEQAYVFEPAARCRVGSCSMPFKLN
jgi:hypothetical protein